MSNLFLESFTAYAWELKCKARFWKKKDAENYCNLLGISTFELIEHYQGPYRVVFHPPINMSKPDYSPNLTQTEIVTNSYARAFISRQNIIFETSEYLKIASWGGEILFQTINRILKCDTPRNVNYGSHGIKHYSSIYANFYEVNLLDSGLEPLEFPVLIG